MNRLEKGVITMQTVDDHDLQRLFDRYLPRCSPPEALTEKLKSHVLAEVQKLRQCSQEQPVPPPDKAEWNPQRTATQLWSGYRVALSWPEQQKGGFMESSKAGWLDSLFHQRYDQAR
jgi:hypothetical protein